ncbi:hypothetical protein [Rhizobium sp. G21]|uniref:hypothetical protein n=1 Tax=Rhizobium sp. G21 TaxID=2758439 RepID=UPI003917B788
MDRSKLFDTVRDPLFGGRFAQPQVDGIDAILDAWDEQGLSDARWLAYMLATAYHETGRRMEPVEENLNYSAVGLRKTFPKYFPTDAIALPMRASRSASPTAPMPTGWTMATRPWATAGGFAGAAWCS